MNQLTIPNKLYGRDRDIKTLLELFERSGRGHGEVLLVPGSSGVGKTALVQELQRPIRNRNGFFIRGKFDQYQQNIPYFAFRQALAQLCRELLSLDKLHRLRIKCDILQSIGNMGQVLVELVPEFESLLGPQPPLGDISPQEARHRFAAVFRNFLKVICRPEHPLVLFIDDWQWADTNSFELLKQMQVGNALRYLLVIVSYRDSEVDTGHPLLSTVDDLRNQAVSVEVLHVKNITAEDVQEFVADTLKPTSGNVKVLAALIHEKTLGNPFFVHSFLIFLNELNLVWFEKAQNCWQWSIEKIEEANLPGNIVELFVMKLRRIDSDSRNLFSLAACLGNRFDVETLSIISGYSSEECLTLLFSDQGKTLILPFDADRRNNPAKDIHDLTICMFLHDRVQQAAYTLIEPAELPHILLKIGRLLLANLQPEKLSERIFEVVGDLNAGHDFVKDTGEKLKIVELNIAAARKAYAGTAYRSALQFYREANHFMETPGFAENLWGDRHELAMRLFKERAECEFLEGDRSEAEKCIQQSVAHARTSIEKADALNILIVQYTLLSRYPEAIASGKQALKTLGISLPDDGYEMARNDEIAQVRRALDTRSISSLIELPVMSNPEMLMASKILITMGPPCYRSHQRLWSVIVPKVVNMTLRYGNIPQVGYSHTAFGGLLGWVDNDYTMAKELGELATRLMTATFRSPSDQSVFYLMIGSSIRHWFKHLRAGTQDYADAFEIGLRSGNLQYAAYAFGHNMYCLFYQGVPLATLIHESRRSLEFSRSRLNQWAIDLLEGGLSVFAALSDSCPSANTPGTWSEDEYLKRVEDHHNIQVTCIYKVLKTFSIMLSGNYDEALALSDEAEPIIYTVGTQGLLPWPEHVFTRLLILTALYSKADAERQAKWRRELDRIMTRLRIWADNCPDNFEHKHLLAAAELARINGKPLEAMQLYDKAIDAAQTGAFLQWQGIANERAYSFWMGCGNELIAYIYWRQAYLCYKRWGAVSKVQSMETEYRIRLAENFPTNEGSGKPDEKFEREIRNAQAERLIEQLRNYAFQVQQTGSRNEVATQAEELAQALERLRQEVSERKNKEELIASLNEQQQIILDSSPAMIFYKDKENRFVRVNEAFSRANGMSKKDMEGKTLWELYPREAADHYWQNDKEVMAVGKPKLNIIESMETPKGTVWVQTDKIPYRDSKGEIIGIIGFTLDITERKRAVAEVAKLEEQNRQLQKAESLRCMAGSIAHHFNNQLTVVQGYLEMVIGDLPKSDPRAVKLTRAMSAALNASEVSGLLLTYLGQMTGKPERVDLSELCRVSLPLIQAGKPENVVLETDLPSPGPYINADAKHIQQILSNLIINAWEAIGDGGGTIHLGVKIVSRTDISESRRPLEWCSQDQNYACLEVTDSGCGIQEKDMDKLFDPFYSTKFTGRGLGLPVVLGIVKAHDAAITVESRIKDGSVFKVFFPLSAQFEIP